MKQMMRLLHLQMTNGFLILVGKKTRTNLIYLSLKFLSQQKLDIESL